VNSNEIQLVVTAELEDYKLVMGIDIREIFENGEKGKYIGLL
jgi:hypothetical protein